MHKGQREKSAVVEQGVNLEDTYIFRQGAEISILRTAAAAEGREGVNSDTPGDSVASRAIVGTIECYANFLNITASLQVVRDAVAIDGSSGH